MGRGTVDPAGCAIGYDSGMTRGLLFDLYGVVMRTQSPEAIAAIERAAGFGGPDLWDPFWSLRTPYDHGLQSGRDYWASIAQAAGRHIADPDAVIAAEVAGWSRPDAAMVDYVRELATRCPVGVLSDVPEDVAEMLEREQPWLWALPAVTLSCRVHVGKPDEAVFRLALRDLGLAAGDVLFTDDRLYNVEAARALGMPAVLFEGLDALRPVVEAHVSAGR